MAKEGNDRIDPYAAFRVPAYSLFVFGSLLVQVGGAAQGLAIGWEMYTRTDDPFALGIVGLLQAIPMLLLTLPCGYLADVYDRKKLMIISMIGTSATSVALFFFSRNEGSIPWMYVLLLLDSAFLRLGQPARVAITPLLVPPKILENAIKWRSSLFQMSAVIGPAVGGFIIAWSVPAAYLFSATTTVIFLFMLLAIKLPDAKRAQRGQILRRLREGMEFVWNKKTLLGAISLDLFAVLLGGAVYLLPVFARDLIEPAFDMTPEQMLGWLRAAPAVGALTMAVYLAHRPPFRRGGYAMLLGVAAFGVATIVFGISTNFWLSWVMLFLTGAFDNISVVVRHTLVQLQTPNEMRGRVSAVNSIFIGSSNELGGFESGAVAKFFGPVVSVISGGIGTLLVVAAWTGLFPALRRFGSFSDLDEDTDTREATSG